MVLIGDVELGQFPELLDVAAQPSSFVFAFVTEDNQTAVVSESSAIRLNWLRWVREALGRSSLAANYTIYKTPIDESGNIIGPREVLQPTPPNDFSSRIGVMANKTSNEFYVEIRRVVVAQGAEDPDRAIYELEACVPQTIGSDGVECLSSGLTVYGIGQPPVLILAGDDGNILDDVKRIHKFNRYGMIIEEDNNIVA